MNRTRAKNRGYVLIVAIFMLPLVAAAVALLGTADVADVRQTFQRQRQAQLEQLLLASIIDARDHLTQTSVKTGDAWTIQLPHDLLLQQSTVETKVTAADASNITITVHAALARQQANQTLHFAHEETRWRLISADLENIFVPN
jgi:type II secretory pathway component PulK